jgi:pyruvate/2-oxoglutarate dehydrogenase complex dihydrolipoamide acyltransferase (E2) component
VSIIEGMQQLVSQPGAWTLPKGKSSTVVLERVGIQLTQQAALLEMDVTRARRQIRLANRGGQSAVSFIAWMVRTVAMTLGDHPDLRPEKTKTQSGSQESVTISLLVDRVVGEHRAAVPVIIHRAETRSVGDIEAMIHRARTVPMDPVTFMAGKPTGPVAALYRLMPGFVQRAILSTAVRNRRRLDTVEANVVISTSGMGGRVRGWFIPTSRHPMCIGIGAVTPEAVVLNGAIEKREIFHMTVLLDSRVIDGKPASRWVSQLVRSVESARELQLA